MTPQSNRPADSLASAGPSPSRRRVAGALSALFACLACLAALVALSPSLAASGPTHARPPFDKATYKALPQAPDIQRGLPYEATGRPSKHDPDASGGPDPYGYIFTDSREPGGPTYIWREGANRIADTSWLKTANINSDPWDDGAITDTMPFTFNFYGTGYSTIRISTNGNVHFGAPNDWFPYQEPCIPSTATTVPKAMLAPLWYDFVVPRQSTGTGGVYTTVLGTSPNRTYVVEWRNVYPYGYSYIRSTFEILINETSNTAIFQYQTDTVAGADGVIGIQNADGTWGLPYACNRNAIVPNLAIRYSLLSGALLSPRTNEAGGAPGATVTYSPTLYNFTGSANAFTISASPNPWTTTVQPTTTGTLPQGGSVPIRVDVQIPPDAPLNSSSVVTITAASTQPTPGAFTAQTVITTRISSSGADFSPTNNQSGDFGSVVNYSTLLTNTSPVVNDYFLTTEGNSWPTTIEPQETGNMSPGQVVPVQVSVQIPTSSSFGDSDSVTIRATGVVTEPYPYFGYTVLTTTAGAWTEHLAMPVARSRMAGVYYPGNRKIYAIGGTSAGGTSLPIAEFDPETNVWIDRASLPVPVSNVGAAVIGSAIYIPGGYNMATGQVETVLQVFYPNTNQVTVLPNDSMPYARQGAGVASAGGKLYVMGGSDDSLLGTNTVLQYDPQHDPSSSGWTEIAPMPTARVYLAAATVNGQIYAAGGMPGSPEDLAVLERFNPVTGSWASLPSMNYPRAGLALVGVDSGERGCGGRLFAIGGGWSDYTNTVERYDVAGNRWEVASSMLEPRRSLGAAYNPRTHEIVAFGGWNDMYEMLVEAAPCGGITTPPTPTVTPCATTFTDVNPGDYFYEAVQYLACSGSISGYSDGTFRPYNYTTRGQLSKIVVLAEGWTLNTPGTATFIDVPVGSAFFSYVETAYAHGIISGYSCGAGCLEFRPGSNITRSQLCKIVVLAEGWAVDTSYGPHFLDVPPSSTFYDYVETAYNHFIISGYADLTFRPGNPATRGQIAKIVFNAITGP